MDENKEKVAPELDTIEEVKEEEVRSKIIAEYGFDEVDDAERIDKATAKELENHKKLSSAIGQKIKYRSEAEALKNDPRLKVAAAAAEPKTGAADVPKLVAEELEKRDLEALDYPDDLKKEIRRIAKIEGYSIRQAVRDPYIVNKIGDYEKTQRAEAATISRTNKSSGSKKSFTFDSPPDVDMTTDEGRKTWEDYKKAMMSEGH